MKDGIEVLSIARRERTAKLFHRFRYSSDRRKMKRYINCMVKDLAKARKIKNDGTRAQAIVAKHAKLMTVFSVLL